VRSRILLSDGAFLLVAGTVQVVLELLGYFAGRGIWGHVLAHSPYTIGWVEAHGLAVLIGLLLVVIARRDGRRYWHGFALAVHLLLGAANLVFWQSFVTFAIVPVGVGTTIAHGMFAVAQTACLTIRGRPATATGQRKCPAPSASTTGPSASRI